MRHRVGQLRTDKNSSAFFCVCVGCSCCCWSAYGPRWFFNRQTHIVIMFVCVCMFQFLERPAHDPCAALRHMRAWAGWKNCVIQNTTVQCTTTTKKHTKIPHAHSQIVGAQAVVIFCSCCALERARENDVGAPWIFGCHTHMHATFFRPANIYYAKCITASWPEVGPQLV